MPPGPRRAGGDGAGQGCVVKKRSSSKAWLREHRADPYVQRALREGYRSRACYKLLELQQRHQLLRPGMTVVDLGSAPGGWSQVAAELVGARGRVVASDLLPMEALPGVTFVQGDFDDEAVLAAIFHELGETGADLVLSDMAPNMSGMAAVDQPRAILLAELALDLAQRMLQPGGAFVCKVFHGEGFEALLAAARGSFRQVQTRKPAASRPRSREAYLVARGAIENGAAAPTIR